MVVAGATGGRRGSSSGERALLRSIGVGTGGASGVMRGMATGGGAGVGSGSIFGGTKIFARGAASSGVTRSLRAGASGARRGISSGGSATSRSGAGVTIALGAGRLSSFGSDSGKRAAGGSGGAGGGIFAGSGMARGTTKSVTGFSTSVAITGGSAGTISVALAGVGDTASTGAASLADRARRVRGRGVARGFSLCSSVFSRLPSLVSGRNASVSALSCLPRCNITVNGPPACAPRDWPVRAPSVVSPNNTTAKICSTIDSHTHCFTGGVREVVAPMRRAATFGGGAPSCGGRISGPASCSETRQPGASARNGMICGQRSSKCATGSVSKKPAARACRPPLPPQMYQPQMPRSGVMRRALSGCWPSVLSATATLSNGEGGTKGEACAVQISCGLRVSTQCGESTTCPRRELSPGAGTAMTGPPEFIEDWIRA